MFSLYLHFRTVKAICVYVVIWCLCGAVRGELDKSRYIGLDEITPGMDAYCLTVYDGAKIEKFPMKVVSIFRGFRPGYDVILVKGTDERFIHTGPVVGCSGSPVYIGGRMAGALSGGWTFSKEPIYSATPIADILSVGQMQAPEEAAQGCAFSYDFSQAVDLDKFSRLMTDYLCKRAGKTSSTNFLPLPLITSAPWQASEQLASFFEPLGFVAVPAASGGLPPGQIGDIELAPGASLAVPLVSGDIKATALGTVTEVVGNKVYGLGHGFLGYGQVDLPLASGYVNTVVTTVVRSFKLGDAVKIVGALRTDESTGVYGQIGASPKLIPLRATVERYNDSEKRVFNCRVANNRELTPALVGFVLTGAAAVKGPLPPDHTIEYKVSIAVEGDRQISFENLSSDSGFADLLTETVSPVGLIMNNPYKRAQIESINLDIRIINKNALSHIWSVELADSSVKPGETVEGSVIVESWLSQKKRCPFSLKIPETMPAGVYELFVCGGDEYERFIRATAPYKFETENFSSLVDAIKNLVSIRRDKLYIILPLPPKGVAIERTVLPYLPASKALVLEDAKRILKLSPYRDWIERRFDTDSVIMDKAVVSITVKP